MRRLENRLLNRSWCRLGLGCWLVAMAGLWSAGNACAQAPANDNFANAAILVGSAGAYSGSTINATREVGEPYHYASTGGHSVWHVWTAPQDGFIIFDTQGSYFNTILAAYTGISVSRLTLLANNDDFYGLQSMIRFHVTRSQAYHIAVDGYGGAMGIYTLNWAYENIITNVPAPAPLLGQMEFSTTNYQVYATTPGFVTVNVITDPGHTTPLTVDYATSNGTAVAGTDYISESGNLIFAPGESNQTVFIRILDNPSLATNLTINLSLSNPAGANAALGPVSNATVTIVGRPVPPSTNSGQFQFTSSLYSVTEHEYTYWWNDTGGDTDYRDIPGALITVNRINGSSGRVLVDYVVTNAVDVYPPIYYQTNLISPDLPRPAIPFTEYIPASGTLVFDDFQTSTNFMVSIWPSYGISNGMPEIQLYLANPRPAPEENPVLIAPTLAIQSNSVLDVINVSSAPRFSFERLNYRVDEYNRYSSSRQLIFTVVLPGGGADDGSVWVDVGYGNLFWLPLNAGSDYARGSVDSSSGTTRLTFKKNDTRQQASVTIYDDTLVEFNEDIPLWFSNSKGRSINPYASEATITILYDDPPPGALDREWNPDNVPYTTPPFSVAPGANSQVYGVAVQFDGKTVLGGDFTSVNTVPRNRVARMNPDGSLDTSFLADPNTGADRFVSQVVVLPASAGTNAGKILIAGGFTSFNGYLRNSIARLNSDGSLDFSFDPGTGADGTVWSVAVQNDGKIVMAGEFYTVNNVVRAHLARLNANGSLDLTFDPGLGTDGTIWAVALESTTSGAQRIYLGGGFQYYNGVFQGGVARLNAGGSLDPFFFSGAGADGPIFALGIQGDGRILLGGAFSDFDSRGRNNIARLNTDGSLDVSYNPGTGANNAIYTITMQVDDKAFIGGLFTSYNGTRRVGMASIKVDGTLDTTFLDTAYNQFAGFGNPFSFQPPNFINSIAIQADGNLMVGGSFTNLGGNEPRWVTDWYQGGTTPYAPVWTRQDKATRLNIARLIGTWGATTNYVGTNNVQVVTPNPSQGPGNAQFALDSYSIDEIQSDIKVTMNRIGGALGTLGTQAATTNRTAVAGVNYSDMNYPEVFPEWYGFMRSDGFTGPLYFDIPILHDYLVAGNLTVDLGLGQPFGQITLGGEIIPLGGALGRTMATLTIVDDDVAHGTIAFNSDTYATNEYATNVILTLVRTNGSVGSVSVDYYTVDGTALAGADYTAKRGTISFSSGVTNATLTIPVLGNATVDFDKTFTVVLTNATGGAVLPGPVLGPGLANNPATNTTFATVTVIDADFAPGRLNFSTASYTTNESGAYALITVTRSGGSVGPLAVWVGVTNGTGSNAAICGMNFVGVTNKLSWVFNETAAKTVLVPLIHDGLVRGTLNASLRLFSATVGSATNANALGSRSRATLLISDDDAYGAFAFSLPAYAMDEDGTGLDVTIQRFGGVSGTCSVQFATFDGSAMSANHDYDATNGTLVFGPGELSKTFRVRPIDNSVQDGNRTLLVALFNPSGGAGLLSPSNAVITIIDDESMTVPAGSVDPTYGIGSGPNLPVYALALQSDGKLIIGGEFTTYNNIVRKNLARLLDNGAIDTTFNVGAGCNDQLRAIALQPDGKLVIGGFFTSFNAVNRARIARLNIDGTLDQYFNPGAGADNPVYALAVQPSDGRIIMGGSFGSYNGVTQPYLVRLNTNGTLHGAFNIGTGPNGPVFAIAVQSDWKILIGGDFTAVNGLPYNRVARLNRDGSVDTTFAVGSGADNTVRTILAQADGRIAVGGSFTNFAGRAYLARLQQNGALDTNFIAGLSGANDSVYTVLAQDDGKLLVGGNFTRFNGVTRNRITRLNQDGTVDPGINFGEGANGFVAALAIQGDRKIVLGGGFTMMEGRPCNHLARLFGGSLAGNGSFEFATPFYNVNETDGVVLLNVMRRGGTFGAASVTYTTYDDTATDGVDYLGATNTLIFPEGEVLQTVPITILNDRLVEPAQDFYVGLDTPTGGADIGDVPYAVVTIINSISQISFGNNAFTVAEATPSGSAVINIMRTAATNTPVTVSYQAVANTNLPNAAVAGVNFTPVSGTLTFLPGQTNKVFLVPILNDGVASGNRTVQLRITAAGPANLINLGLTDAVLTILDAQFSPGVLSFAQSVYRVPEHGTNAVINVIRNNGASGIVSARCTTSNGSGVAGVDYASVNVILAFADGETNKNFLVPIIDNPALQANTTVNLALSQPGGGAMLAPPTNALLIIEDFESTPAHVSFVTTNFGVMESDAFALITVTRTDNLLNQVTVDFTTADGTANDALDYLGTNGTLVFGPSETVKTFTVPIIFDQLGEPTETVVLTLSNPSANAAINIGYALLYITNTPLAGSVDDTFNARWGADGPVYAAVFDASENLYVAGSFQYLNGLAVNSVGRMTTNGTVDPTFNPGLGPNGPVYALGRSTNGLVMGGAFTNVNSYGRSHVARLKYDGSVDAAFSSTVGTDGDVLALAVQLDDRVVVGGSFRNVGGQSFNNIGRLYPNGTVDANFQVGGGANGTVRAIALMSYTTTGSPILIGGDFTRVNGAQRNHLARLNPDGSLDNTFATGLGPDGPVYGVAVLGDGTVVIVGGFATVDGVPRSRVARLNAAGTVDLTFDPGTGANALVRAVDIQVDGKIVLAGDFTAFNGNTFNRLVRLAAVGTVDATFLPGTGADQRIYGLALGSSGQAIPKQGVRLEPTERLGVEPRIVGGKPASISSFPYQVVLLWKPFSTNDLTSSYMLCGGSIVNDQWILTAAHCSVGQDPNGVAVGVGITDRTQPQGGRVFSVDQIIVHPNYDAALNQNDVALWHLTEAINFNGSYVAAPVRLASPADAAAGATDPGVMATITGWGTLSSGGNVPNVLQVGVVPITTTSQYLNPPAPYPSHPITPDMMMAGFSLGGVDTCQGDSGGPLVVTNAQKIVLEAGVTSWGYGCADGRFPGVYARVSWFYDWIISQINQIPPGPGQSTSTKLAFVGEFSQFNGVPRKRVAVLDTTGANSATFDPGALPNNTVFTMAIYTNQAQPTLQGKIIAAGTFSQLVGVGQQNRVARLNMDGTIDTNFNVGFGPDQPVRAMVMQPDGRVILGGLFTNVNQAPRAWLARLNTDGSLDPNYNAGAGLNGAVYSLALQADQRVVLGGTFTMVYGVPRVGLARMTPLGTVDTTFNPGAGANGAVNAIVIDGDGGFIIGGDFTTIDNTPRNHIARLLPSGALDTNFVVGAGFNGTVYALAITGGGRILVGGGFTSYDGVSAPRLARLQTGGNLDSSFNAGLGADEFVSSISLQSDGKVLVGGGFLAFNGQLRNRLVRLNSDGSLDPTINFGTGADKTVYGALVQYYDGMIVVGGSFTSFNGQPRVALARLLGGANSGAGIIEFGSSSYSVSEAGTNVLLTVLRVGGAAGPAAVRLGTTDVSARSGQDYLGTNVTLAFNNAETFKTLAVRVFDNRVVDGNRTFLAGLSSPTSAVLGTPASALVTILDNDCVVSFVQSQYTVAEGGGVARILVTRAGGAIDTTTVGYATGPSGTAITNLDYVPVSGTLTFNPGVVVQSFDVPIIDNAVISPNQTVSLLLSNVTGSSTLGLSRATLTIINNDFGPGILSLSTNSYVVSASAINVLINVVRTNGFTGPVGVGFFTSDGTATAGVDYVSTNGVLNFADGETNKSILISIIPNTLPIGDVVFQVTLTNATGGATLSGGVIAVVRITDHVIGPGSVDQAFNPGVGANRLVRTVALDSQGRFLVGGGFTNFNNLGRNGIVRLNSDGSLDLGFAPGVGANFLVNAVAADSLDRVLVGGVFTNVGGVSFNHMARLLTNGLPDATYSQPNRLNAAVTAFAFEPDGTIVVVGGFSQPASGVARLRPDGGVDTSFDPGTGADGPVHAVALATVGGSLRIVVGGSFNSFDGFTRSRVARLNQNGEVDTAFVPPTVAGTVYSVAIQPDGKVIIGGTFTNVGGVTRRGVARLTVDGAPDMTFDPGAGLDGTAYALAWQSDGRILVGGDFTHVNQTNRNRIARLNSNGSLDLSFDTASGADGAVYAILVLPDSEVLIGGDFTHVNKVPRSGVALLNGSGPAGMVAWPGTLDSGGFHVWVNSTPGLHYVLMASDDLVGWFKVDEATASAVMLELTDVHAAGRPWRFYRVEWVIP